MDKRSWSRNTRGWKKLDYSRRTFIICAEVVVTKNHPESPMLKKFSTVLIITLLLGGSAFAFQQAAWAKVDSTEGRFSVVMPTTPQTSSSDVDTKLGKLKLYSFSSSSKVGEFMLSYADYPNEATGADRDKVLDGVIDGVLKGLQAELISQNKVSLNAYPGREMRARRTIEGSEMIFSWKVVLVGKRLYQMGVGTSKIDSESPEIQKFFMSLQLSN